MKKQERQPWRFNYHIRYAGSCNVVCKTAKYLRVLVDRVLCGWEPIGLLMTI
jgi:hypothetical protein